MSESDTVPIGVAVACGAGALILGAVAAWVIAPDAPQGPTQAVPTVTVERPAASFSFEHEASQDDAFSPAGGFNAWLWTWPDGSQDWCFHYTQAGSNESTQPVCKPVPADYNTEE